MPWQDATSKMRSSDKLLERFSISPCPKLPPCLYEYILVKCCWGHTRVICFTLKTKIRGFFQRLETTTRKISIWGLQTVEGQCPCLLSPCSHFKWERALSDRRLRLSRLRRYLSDVSCSTGVLMGPDHMELLWTHLLKAAAQRDSEPYIFPVCSPHHSVFMLSQCCHQQ